MPCVEAHLERRLDLRQQDEVGRDAGRDERVEVAHPGGGMDVVHPQPADLPGREVAAVSGTEVLDESRAGLVLAGERHGVLEIEDQSVGAGRSGLGEAVGAVARREEEDAAEGDVGGRGAHA